jgi:hypothetical protein
VTHWSQHYSLSKLNKKISVHRKIIIILLVNELCSFLELAIDASHVRNNTKLFQQPAEICSSTVLFICMNLIALRVS